MHFIEVPEDFIDRVKQLIDSASESARIADAALTRASAAAMQFGFVDLLQCLHTELGRTLDLVCSGEYDEGRVIYEAIIGSIKSGRFDSAWRVTRH